MCCKNKENARDDEKSVILKECKGVTRCSASAAYLMMPSLVVQEKGYNNRSIGTNAKSFFYGLLAGLGQAQPLHRHMKKDNGITGVRP